MFANYGPVKMTFRNNKTKAKSSAKQKYGYFEPLFGFIKKWNWQRNCINQIFSYICHFMIGWKYQHLFNKNPNLAKKIKCTHVRILDLKFEPKTWKTKVYCVWLKIVTFKLNTLYRCVPFIWSHIPFTMLHL